MRKLEIKQFMYLKMVVILFNFFFSQDLQKYTLLMEIADSEIERLCLSLIIPVVRPNSIKVFSHILCSAQSRDLFIKIVPRIPKLLQALNHSNDSQVAPDVQLFIDLVSAFVHRYGVYDLKFVEIVSFSIYSALEVFELDFELTFMKRMMK